MYLYPELFTMFFLVKLYYSEQVEFLKNTIEKHDKTVYEIVQELQKNLTPL
jgi:hypothetical protein